MGVDEVVEALIPPGISKSLKWRLAVSISIAGIFCWIFWASGAFSVLGFPGFARADETKQLSARLQNIEDYQKTGLRLQLAQEICRVYFLRQDASGDAWRVFGETLNKHQDEYAAINQGNRYPVTECSKPK